jgi:2-oxoglutarate ferredoxin oxidoreductase subunit beta
MLNWMKDNSILKKRADKLDPEEIVGKILVGDFQNQEAPEFTDNICKLLEDKCTSGWSSALRSAYRGD